MRVLALVPARGGSKGIPRKNLADFRGRPLIAHTLDAVANAQSIADVVVSSDDPEIREFAKTWGFRDDYVRPSYLGLDDTPITAVVRDVLEWFELRDAVPLDYILVLQPTSPLRTSRDIEAFIDWLRRSRPQSAASVHRMREHPQECVRLGKDGEWSFVVEPPVRAVGRQAYSAGFFFINGAMYAAQPHFLYEHDSFTPSNARVAFFEMDPDHGLDIDEPHDLAR